MNIVLGLATYMAVSIVSSVLIGTMLRAGSMPSAVRPLGAEQLAPARKAIGAANAA